MDATMNDLPFSSTFNSLSLSSPGGNQHIHRPSTPPQPPSLTLLPPHSPTSPFARPVSRHNPYPQRQHGQAPTSSFARRRRSAAQTPVNGVPSHGGQYYFAPHQSNTFPLGSSPEESFPPTPGTGREMNYDLKAVEDALNLLTIQPTSSGPSPETTVKESFAQVLSALNDIRKYGLPTQSRPVDYSNEEVMEAYERGVRDIENARTMLSWAVSELRNEMEGWRERLK